MNKQILELTDLINYGFETSLRTGATTPVPVNENSIMRTSMGNSLLDYKLQSFENWHAGFETLKDEFTNTLNITLPLSYIDSNNDGVADSLVMMYKIVTGEDRATFYRGCDDINFFPCDTADGTRPNLANETGNIQQELAIIGVKDEWFHFKKCLSEVMQLTSDFIRADELAVTGITMSGTETLATAVVKYLHTAIKKAEFYNRIVSHYADDGVIAKFMVGGSLNKASVRMDRVDMLRMHEMYAIFRPNPGTLIEYACIMPCGKTHQLVGYATLYAVADKITQTAQWTRQHDLNGVLMPDFNILPGDEVVPVGGIDSVVTGGYFGAGYRVIEPTWGINTGQTTGYTAVKNCCRYDGYSGLIKLYQQYNNLGTFTNPGTYFGLDLTKYHNQLVPQVYCCTPDEDGTANFTQFTADTILSALEFSYGRMAAMKSLGWKPALTNQPIVLYAARFTMRRISEMIIDAFPTAYSAQKNIQAPNTNPRWTVIPQAEEALNMVFVGMNIQMKVIENGFPEGRVYVGPKSGFVTVTHEDLRGDGFKEYSYGNLVQEVPSSFVGRYVTPKERAEYKNEIIVSKLGATNPDTMWVDFTVRRFADRVNLLGGAATIFTSVPYRLPGDCPPGCAHENCPNCNL